MENNHIMLHGDCLDVLKKLPAESIDLIFTDPPYNQGIRYVKKDFKDSKKLPDYVNWLKERLVEMHRVLKKNGSMYLMNYPELNARFLPFLEDEMKMKLKRWIVWHYPTNIGHSKKNWTRSHRSILFLTKSKEFTFNRKEILQKYKNLNVGKIKKRLEKGSIGRGAYDVLKPNDIKEIFEMKGRMGDIVEINLLKNTRKERKSWHNCQLPPELIEIFISVSSNPGDTILDPFAGTFSTSLAAKNLGRKSIGIELSTKYVKYGTARLR